MALLDKLRKGEGAIPPMNEPPAPPAPETEGSVLPVGQIKQMRTQGFNNNQIVQTLQRDGFDSSQIFEAFNQVDTPSAAPVSAPPGAEAMPPPEMPPPPPGAPPAMPAPGMPASPPIESGREKIEELAEVIIDEKWEELIKSLNKIVEWKDATEARINKIEQQFKDVKSDFDNLHKAIIGKIGEYDQNILNVGTEIKAMEKVFQKILPTFTENVAELSRITKKARGPKAPKK